MDDNLSDTSACLPVPVPVNSKAANGFVELDQAEQETEHPKTCVLCDRRFETISELSLHFLKHGLVDNLQIKYGIDMIFCEICGETFESADSLEEHCNDNHAGHNEFVWSCEACDIDFANEVELLIHESEAHFDVNVMLTGDNLQCALCPKEFPSKYLLGQHITEHLMKKIPCRWCDKHYSTHAAVHRHHIAHNFQRECKICGKRLYNDRSLKYHMDRVHGNTKFVCAVCGKIFNGKPGLHLHMRIHTQEKKYSCDVCPYRTRKRGDLTVRKNNSSVQRVHDFFVTGAHKEAHFRTTVQVHFQRLYCRIQNFKPALLPCSSTPEHPLVQV